MRRVGNDGRVLAGPSNTAKTPAPINRPNCRAAERSEKYILHTTLSKKAADSGAAAAALIKICDENKMLPLNLGGSIDAKEIQI